MSAILALKLLAAGERQQRLMRVRTPHESRSPSQSPLSFLCLVHDILFPYLPREREVYTISEGAKGNELFFITRRTCHVHHLVLMDKSALW